MTIYQSKAFESTLYFFSTLKLTALKNNNTFQFNTSDWADFSAMWTRYSIKWTEVLTDNRVDGLAKH